MSKKRKEYLYDWYEITVHTGNEIIKYVLWQNRDMLIDKIRKGKTIQVYLGAYNYSFINFGACSFVEIKKIDKVEFKNEK